MNRKTKYLYFSSLDFDNVFKTQVIGWITLYRQNGLDYEIVRTAGIKKLKSIGRKRAEQRKIGTLFKGKCTDIYLFPESLLAGRILNTVLLSFILLCKGIGRRNVVIQIRFASLYRTLGRLKSIFGKRLRIVYDCRAAGAEEFLYIAEHKNRKTLEKYEMLKEADRKMAALSDKIFCVSNVLIGYIRKLSANSIPQDQFYLYPCSADEHYFRFDKTIREKTRDTLKLTNQTVFTYSGGLQLRWHVPDKIFALFGELRSRFSNSYFLVLTSDISLAEEYFAQYEIPRKSYRVINVDNREVYRYLNAADFGILLREDHIMNNVASPTKFAEYLMCGLPVIISPGVGDFSQIIRKTGYGIEYRNPESLKHFSPDKFSPTECRKAISNYGREHFSKQARLKELMELYGRLGSNNKK